MSATSGALDWGIKGLLIRDSPKSPWAIPEGGGVAGGPDYKIIYIYIYPNHMHIFRP